MKKWLLVLIVLIGVPATYYGIGLKTEETLRNQLGIVQEMYGVHFTLVKKTRGIFSSTYRYTMQYAIPQKQGKPETLTLTLRETVSHGPLPFTAGSWKPALAVIDTALEPGGAQSPLALLLAKLPALGESRLRTTVGFSGESRTVLSVPPCKGTWQDRTGWPVVLEWQGAEGSIGASPKGRHLSVTFEAPALSIKEKDATFSLQGLRVAGASTRHGEHLYLGDTTINLKDLRFKAPASPDKSVVLSQVTFSGSSSQRGDVVDGNMRFAGNATVAGGKKNVSMKLALSMQDVDFKALDATVGEMQRIGLRQAPDDVRTQQMLALLQRQAIGLLSKNPRIRLEELAIGLPSGNVEASGEVRYAGSGGVADSTLLALRRLRASAKVQASYEALLEVAGDVGNNNPDLTGQAARQQVESFLADMVTKGLVTRNAGVLSSSAQWDGKVLRINGQPLFQMP